MHISTETLPKPTQRQLEFQDLELGLFIHYGLPTYTGYDNRGQDSPGEFKPQSVDCDSWMAAAKAMGARFAVLTTRHEEGFCLWPTATTSYSVASSPYRDGHGDVVREFIDACDRHGVVPCLYHPSMHDAHHVFQPGDPADWPDGFFTSTNKRLSDPARLDNFITMQRQQVRELLTNYGPIRYLWLDHMTETHGIIDATTVTRFWDAIIEEARRWQPECLLLKCGDLFEPRRGCEDRGPWRAGRVPALARVSPRGCVGVSSGADPRPCSWHRVCRMGVQHNFQRELALEW